MIPRNMAPTLAWLAGQYPVVVVTGPRQSGATVTRDFFKGLAYWSRLTGQPGDEGWIIYGGEAEQDRAEGRVVGWRALHRLLEALE